MRDGVDRLVASIDIMCLNHESEIGPYLMQSSTDLKEMRWNHLFCSKGQHNASMNTHQAEFMYCTTYTTSHTLKSYDGMRCPRLPLSI